MRTVTGESWLQHLHRNFDESSMGKTGVLGPPTAVAVQRTTAEALGGDSQTVTLSGSDLYRLNCRGCHGEFGDGAPPEINSLIEPVRATSLAAVMARMKSAGAEISRADATKLAEQSKMMLLQRLHNGGQDMPAFPQLTATDVKVLLGYLKQLAEVPGAKGETAVSKATPLRVGELIVRSTCHVCHAATGKNPTPQQLADGAIPPLSTLTLGTNRAEFVQKVTQGAPVAMGSPALIYRGRMPVFYYLSEQEAADVYQYLLAYPPDAGDVDDPVLASSGNVTPARRPPGNVNVAILPNQNIGIENAIVLPAAGLLVLLLLGGGAALTRHEMAKLVKAGARPKQPDQNAETTSLSAIRDDLVA